MDKCRDAYTKRLAAEFEFMRITDANGQDLKDEEGFYKCIPLEIDNGWFEIVYFMCKDLYNLHVSFKMIQIKEKFGLLRVYVSSTTEEIEQILDTYESLSKTVCGHCGRVHSENDPVYYDDKSGWIGYMCKKCWDDYWEERR